MVEEGGKGRERGERKEGKEGKVWGGREGENGRKKERVGGGGKGKRGEEGGKGRKEGEKGGRIRRCRVKVNESRALAGGCAPSSSRLSFGQGTAGDEREKEDGWEEGEEEREITFISI